MPLQEYSELFCLSALGTLSVLSQVFLKRLINDGLAEGVGFSFIAQNVQMLQFHKH